MYKLQTKKPSSLILIKLISSPSIGAVLFTPGLPEIIRYFGISEALGQLTLTLFLVGYACGQLLYAPIAIRWGRRPTIFFGMGIAVVGSILAILSEPLHSFTLLLIARLVMALGSSVGLVLTFTIINDFYYEHQARRIVPIVSLAFAVVPFIGITIGGLLVHLFGWNSCFYFIAVYNLFVLLLCRLLPETSTELDPHATRVVHIKQRYLAAFKNKRLISFSLLFGLTTTIIYTFAAVSPLIVIDLFGVSPLHFGLLNLVVAIGYFLGNLISVGLSKHLSGRAVISLGYGIFSLAILTFACFCALKLINLYSFYIPFFFVYLGLPLSFSNAAVFATAQYKDRPTGASVMMFTNMIIATLGVLILSALPGSLLVTLPLVLIVILVLYFFLFSYTKRLI
ncbi:MAG: Bicyclomycin resistance protein [Chlamydiae bacterium]|nr:Bicyclomycin resistance protein [Chlamydiota bacterium]